MSVPDSTVPRPPINNPAEPTGSTLPPPERFPQDPVVTTTVPPVQVEEQDSFGCVLPDGTIIVEWIYNDDGPGLSQVGNLPCGPTVPLETEPDPAFVESTVPVVAQPPVQGRPVTPTVVHTGEVDYPGSDAPIVTAYESAFILFAVAVGAGVAAWRSRRVVTPTQDEQED